MNYSKWDAIEDSDEENEKRQARYKSYQNEEHESRRQQQVEVDSWLRRTISKLPREGDPNTKRLRESMPEIGGANRAPAPIRMVTKTEREALSMLICLSHFEEGDTNLDRHPLMLDLTRHNRWLEEDPGALELLCRVHNHVMKGEGGGDNARHTREFEDPENHRMRNMTLSAINTLAAPKRAKCPGGLLELFTQICTPETEAARELRRKWQTKEFGKDALFDSLFPDLRQYTEDNGDDGFGNDFWIIVVLALLAVLGIIAFIVLYYSGALATPSRTKAKTANNSSGVSLPDSATIVSGSSVGDILPSDFGPLPQSEPALSAASHEPASSAPAPPPPPAGRAVCADSNENCASWAQTGECTSNAEFMLANCRLSCSVCQVSAPAPPRPHASADKRGDEL